MIQGRPLVHWRPMAQWRAMVAHSSRSRSRVTGADCALGHALNGVFSSLLCKSGSSGCSRLLYSPGVVVLVPS